MEDIGRAMFAFFLGLVILPLGIFGLVQSALLTVLKHKPNAVQDFVKEAFSLRAADIQNIPLYMIISIFLLGGSIWWLTANQQYVLFYLSVGGLTLAVILILTAKALNRGRIRS